MASSSSSDESSKAPEKFQISCTSNDEDDEAIEFAGIKSNKYKQPNKTGLSCSSPSLKCLVCLRQQNKFHCRNCVKSGYITRSGQPYGECLSEKQQKFLNVQGGLKTFSQKYERLIKDKRENENLLFAIKRHRQQVDLLRQLIAKKKLDLQTLSNNHKELCKSNADKRKTLPKYPIKVKELGDYVLDRKEKIGDLRERHFQLLEKLKYERRLGIKQLVEYIFPISEIVLKDERPPNKPKSVTSPSQDTDTIAALADAKNTSYIRGKWIFHGSGISEMQYRIVAPSLPANGDYTAYLDWLKDNNDDVPKTASSEIVPSRVNGFRIVGALTYTTQLLQLICYYLNVRLPYKIVYGDFCKKLNEEQFLRKVSRLNSNILYLAYTQQVKLRSLNENHTLENVLIILDPDKSDLGRHGFQTVGNAPLIKSTDSLILGIDTDSESEDENSLRLDWEAVPSLPPQHEHINTNFMTTAAGSQQQSTIAEGLITSAANRITSFFRWIK